MRKLSDLKEAPEHLKMKAEINKQVIAKQVCKDCHGTLSAHPDPNDRDLVILVCADCWIHCSGFVSRTTAERIEQEGKRSLREMKRNYPEYYGKDEIENPIESLGYGGKKDANTK